MTVESPGARQGQITYPKEQTGVGLDLELREAVLPFSEGHPQRRLPGGSDGR